MDIRNVAVRNLHSEGGIFPAGVVRCDEKNPCTGMEFTNTNITAWWDDLEWSFITEYATGPVTNATPAPVLDSRNQNVFKLETK